MQAHKGVREGEMAEDVIGQRIRSGDVKGGERGSQNESPMSYGYDTTLRSSPPSLQLGPLIHISSPMKGGEGEPPHSPGAPQSP